ncbi:MAG: dimethyl sulfoxide reductase anchor subunit [Chloroflexi bacterium]|nr:dimethyl sulfoxide reductase anchor subunit [Chloroflexota bacterium]
MLQDNRSQNGETALVVFTLLMPTSVGMSFIGMLNGRAAFICLAAAIVGALGLAASLLHLARPLRAPFSVLHWRQSWLSREILAATGYWCVVVAWCLSVWIFRLNISRLLAIGSVIMGIILLFVIAQAYRMHTLPAWDGPETLYELFAVMLGVGVVFGILTGWSFLEPGMFLAGTLGIGIGAGLDYWACRHRTSRLNQISAQSNVHATLVIANRIMPIIRFSWGLNVLSFFLSIIAVIVGGREFGLILWILILLAEVTSHIRLRNVFYVLPVQTRFTPRLRQPWSRPSVH